MTRLLLALLAAGCVSIPEPANHEVDAPDGAAEATALAVATWTEYLGIDRLGEPPPIRWFDGPCLDYQDGDTGCELGGTHLWWYFAGAPEIHLIAQEPMIGHEILHWVLEQEEWQDPDKDHAGPEWQILRGVEAVLHASGWSGS